MSLPLTLGFSRLWVGERLETVSTVSRAPKTDETVFHVAGRAVTPLKRGVNETGTFGRERTNG